MTGKPPPKPSAAKHARPGGVQRPGQDWTRRLLGMAEQLRLTEDERFARVVAGIIRKGDQRAAQKLVQRLEPASLVQQLRPDHFLSTEADRLAGEFLIGHTRDGHPVGLDRSELVRHVLISGQSGTGKSTLLRNLVYQARERGLHVVHWDRKGDLEHAARDGVENIPWAAFRLNPLCPPHPGVSPHEFRSDFAKLFSELFQFWARGHAILLKGVDQLYSDFGVYDHWSGWDWSSRVFPTLADLLALFETPRFGKAVKGRGKDSLFSITDKLTSLLIELAPIVSCQRGFDLARLQREQRVVNLSIDGLSVEYQNYLILTALLHYAALFKTTGPRGRLNALFLFDEAKGIIGAENKQFIVKDLVSKVREWGLGLVCADQMPSEIGQFLFSNIGTLIFFRHSDGNDLRRLQYSAGATPEQIRANYELQPGQAVVRLMKSKDLHHVTVPFQPVDKFISRAELAALTTPRLAELSRDVLTASLSDGVQSTTAAGSDPATNSSFFDDDEQRFLKALAEDFARPSSAVYRELGLSNSAGFRLKKRLLTKKALSQVLTNLGKGGKQAAYLVPNPVVLEALGVSLERHGRGGALHQYFQAELKRRCDALGFSAVIEENRSGTGETPDLGVTREGWSAAVEICITSKPSTEVANIAKNVGLGYDHVVLSFVNARLLVKTGALAATAHPADTLRRVSFCLINQVSETLEKELQSWKASSSTRTKS